MTINNKETIRNLLFAGILYELHLAEDKLNYFRSKYKTDLKNFEAAIKNSKEENFAEWDDYLEWKGFQKNHEYLISQKEAIENENYKVA